MTNLFQYINATNRAPIQHPVTEKSKGEIKRNEQNSCKNSKTDCFFFRHNLASQQARMSSDPYAEIGGGDEEKDCCELNLQV